MQCPRCATDNPAKAKFCLECGSSLMGTADASAPGVRPGEAERRQLTCLFSDLVNSVQLSERLDPEELRDTLAAYRSVCKSVVSRYGGRIEKYSGDGIMVHFGLPSAHEDDAQRAVLSGLGIIEAVARLDERMGPERGIGLHVRIGIDTGLVVAGGIGADEGTDVTAAVGPTPNIAARLQSLAAPDSLVISAATYRLVAGLFDCRELGFRTVRGLSQPMAIYLVLHESAARTRLDVAAQRGLPPMHGRDGELRRLTERWAQARGGHGSVALVVGEPGIGKSRLIRSLQEHVAQSADAFLIPMACSPYYANTAFHPVVQVLERALRYSSADTADQRLDKIGGLVAQYGFDLPSVVPLLADLLGVPLGDRYARLELPADRQRQLTIDTLVEIWLRRAGRQPVLFVVEDLQWVDPSTLDLLTRLIERVPRSRQLVVASSRPDFPSPWPDGPRFDRLDLSRLDHGASVRIVAETADGPVPDRLLSQILGKADGVPLYLEELTKLVVEEGSAGHGDERPDPAGPPPALAIPTTLADSLTARLDRLAEAKGVAQLGAVIGRQFTYELLVAVSGTIAGVDPEALKHSLDRLVDAGLLYVEHDMHSETYTFKHALIQDAAYASLLHTTRRQYHRRIAQVLVEQFPATVATAPELLARHYSEAGMIAESVPHWLKAGERARQASANPEAIAHLTTGLRLLTQLPAGPERTGQELQLRLALGPAYMAIRGYAAPDVEASYQRARELCRELGDPPQIVPVLHGLWSYHVVRAQHGEALALGEQILELGAAADDDGLLLQGNLDVGWSHFFRGELEQARDHLERVLTLYDHERHSSHAFTYGGNPATSARGCLAQALWMLGHVDQALQHSEANLGTLRSQVEHPFSVAFGLDVAATLYQFVGDASTTRRLADEAILISERHGLTFIGAMASILAGWARTREGELEQGLLQMRRGLAAQVDTGGMMARPYWLCLIAEACHRAGSVREGLDVVAEAETAVEDTRECLREAEVHRLHGQLVLATSSPADPEAARTAEASYLRALHIARGQHARSLELRAAVALSRLWQARGREDEARDLLVPVVEWFSEGLETPDLRQAAAVLGDLGVELVVRAT